jgi:polyphosphate glucokinase
VPTKTKAKTGAKSGAKADRTAHRTADRAAERPVDRPAPSKQAPKVDGAPAQAEAKAPPRLARRVGLGIDIGGTGVKAALVNLDTGDLVSRRVRMATPQPATPAAVAGTVRAVVDAIAEDVPLPAGLSVGAGLPVVIKRGEAMTAANIDKAWVGISASELLGEALGRPVFVLNDADAAAIAEERFGAGRDHSGTVLVLTIGTGIGSGLIIDGKLVPNTEFGHIELKGRDAEKQVSGVARERRRLRWKAWALEFNEYLARLEAYLSPDLIILGGGVSKVLDKYREFLVSRAPIVAAQFLNTSGIIGAALAAADQRDARRDAQQSAVSGKNPVTPRRVSRAAPGTAAASQAR